MSPALPQPREEAWPSLGQPDISSLGYDSKPMVTKSQSTAGTELSWPQWYPEEAGLWLLTYLL